MHYDMAKVRKSLFELKMDKKEEVEQKFFLTKIKKELFKLDLDNLLGCNLPEAITNLTKFRAFLDKLDSYNFSTDLNNNIEFDPVEEMEIQEIKTVSKMKEFLRKCV